MHMIKCVAVGLAAALLGLFPAHPASAIGGFTPTACDERMEWQIGSGLGAKSRHMDSCYLDIERTADGGAAFTVRTRIYSDSFWFGFHACVEARLVNAAGVVVAKSTPQRFGVDASQSRLIDWSGSVAATTSWSTARFDHFRC